MKKYFFLFAALLFSMGVIAQETTGIQFFKGSWEEVLKESQQKSKPIFLDAYAAWCGPCRWMDNNVFPQPEVGEYYNANFINYKLDMEKGEGPKVAQMYRVTAYPTFLYLDHEGNVKYRIMGGRMTEDFIKEGKNAVTQFQ